MSEIEIFVIIDENGDYSISRESSELQEQYTNDHGGDIGEIAVRLIAVKIKVPTPKPITVSATLPEEANEAIVSVK